MMEDVNGKIKDQITQYLEQASEEERNVLHFLIEGLSNKRQREKNTYLSSLLKFNSSYHEENQTLEMTLPNSDVIQNSLNIVHGGITATLLDTAMGTLAHHLLPPELAAVTSEMKINYLAPGVGKDLRCIATILHKGSKTIVCEGKVFRDDGKLIAHSTASFFIITRRKSE